MAGYFKAVFWVGDGTGTRAITVGFQPDYVWSSASSAGATIRGHLPSLSTSYARMGDQNGNWVATTGANSILATATGLSVQSEYNSNGVSYVAFCWRSYPTVSYLLNYTGNGSARSISHSLGAAPDFIFPQWYPASGGSGNDVTLLSMPLIKAFGMVNIQDFGIASNNKFTTANNNIWNSSAPTSSVYNLGGAALQLNTNARLYYAYMFANKVGFLKTGIYTGNGSNNGVAIDAGFIPKAIMFNRADAVANGAVPSLYAAVMTNSGGTTSPWTKFQTMPSSATWSTDANGVVISGNTFAPPLSQNANGVIYSYIAWGEGDIDGGGSVRGVGWSGVTRLWPTYKNVATQAGVGGNTIPGIVAP